MSGTRQRFAGVAANQAIVITEFANDYTTMARVPQPLSGTTPNGTLQAN